MSAPLAVLFSLVLRLQLTQQCPGENDGQEETHENSKADKNRSHEKLKIIPASPSTSTTAPIIDATNPTYFCSKSCAITNQPHSNSVSKTSIDESPPNQTPKTVRLGRPIRDPGPHTPAMPAPVMPARTPPTDCSGRPEYGPAARASPMGRNAAAPDVGTCGGVAAPRF